MIVWFSGNGHLWQHTLILDAARYLRLFRKIPRSVPRRSFAQTAESLLALTEENSHLDEMNERYQSTFLWKYSPGRRFTPPSTSTFRAICAAGPRDGSPRPPVGRYPLVRGKIFARATRARDFRRVYSTDPRIKRRI